MRTHPADGEHCVVRRDLLCPSVSSTAVGEEDDNACQEGDAGHGENELLWPGIGVVCPGRLVALVRQSLGGVEDGEGGGKHGEDDESTAEVDAT